MTGSPTWLARFGMRSASLRASRGRGFTLIEVMVVVAALGILAAVVVAKYRGATVSPPPHNIAREIVDHMEQARKTAAAKKADVWVIFYPGFSRRSDSLSSGRGAYFIFENPTRDFNAAEKTTEAGALRYRQGLGVDFDPVAKVTDGPNGKVTASDLMEEYKWKVRFRVNVADLALGPTEAPFPAMKITHACTWCSEGRGAVVFTPDGKFSFVDGVGNPVDSENHTQTITLTTDGTRKTSVIAMNSADGKIAAFQK